MPIAVYALAAGAFGIGATEFVIMGLLLQVSADLGVSVPAAGLLITGYALGVFAGAPILTLATRNLPRKTVLLALMAIFTLGNLGCALAPDYASLMVARVVTALAHGTFFGVGSVVATSLVASDRKATAIAVMFTGLTAATLLGVPFGAWLGLAFGWRATFWAVAAIGLLAMLVLARFVSRDGERPQSVPLREELAVLARPQVLLGLLMTVLGFGGVFALYTYVQPILTELTGFSKAAVAPILLVFGGGLAVGNLLGGRLADRRLGPALVGTLAGLAVVLGLMTFAVHDKIGAVVGIGLLGVAAFATVAPLQLRVLETAGDSGRNLAASLNIAAFNLGNALGAWLGGAVIDHGPGLGALPWSAALVTVAGLAVTFVSLALDRRAGQPAPALADACPLSTEGAFIMEYRRLGASGLKVPALSFGAGTFGGQGPLFSAWGDTDVAGARRLVDVCLDAGVTMFDTADVYSSGASEEILGQAVKGRRDQVILSTKTGLPMGDGPNDAGSSRARLIPAVEAALKRLETDYIDLLQLHAFDAFTPVEEVLSTLDELVRAGKVRYVGVSNFSGWQLMKSLAAADRHGWPRYVAHQAYYSLVGRDYEGELMPLGLDQGVGAVVWSPLGWGRLTGKIRRGQPLPERSRLHETAEFGPPVDEELLYRVVDALDVVAEETGKTVPQVALNWLLQRPTVSTVVVGARDEAQLRQNLGAVGWALTADQIARLDAASATTAAYPYWPYRRQAAFARVNPPPV